MSTAADPGVHASTRNLASEHEELLQQAMAVPEVLRAMEAYAALAMYQTVLAAAVQQKVIYATGGNAPMGVTPSTQTVATGANP